MQQIVVLLCLLAVASADHGPAAHIVRDERLQVDNSFGFHFVNSDGHEQREEQGRDGVRRGFYTFVNRDGKRERVAYEAGPQIGFRVLDTTHGLPTPPLPSGPAQPAPVSRPTPEVRTASTFVNVPSVAPLTPKVASLPAQRQTIRPEDNQAQRLQVQALQQLVDANRRLHFDGELPRLPSFSQRVPQEQGSFTRDFSAQSFVPVAQSFVPVAPTRPRSLLPVPPVPARAVFTTPEASTLGPLAFLTGSIDIEQNEKGFRSVFVSDGRLRS